MREPVDKSQSGLDPAFGTSLAEQRMDALVAAKYGLEPTGCSERVAAELEPLSAWFGVITSRERWPKQAKFQKGDRVEARHTSGGTSHLPAKRSGQVGTVVGFSREAPSERGFRLGYMSAGGGNQYVIEWQDGSLTKIRPCDLEAVR
jgi:hypothetical protein